MKTLLQLTLATAFALVGSAAQAVPVMNENAAQSPIITIFPDHADPALFYIAPNYLTICEDLKAGPRFSYQDLSVENGKHGIVQMTLCAYYNEPDLETSKAQILAKIPTARFTALPFLSSEIKFNEVLKPLVVKEFCTHAAGTVGDEQVCSFRLNIRGRQVFIRNIRDRVTMTMNYEYSVAGFIKNPAGGFDAQKTTYGVAVRIGGATLKAHPELFVDSHGRPLK